MMGSEQGFLLLTSLLGDPERKVLTPAQLRTLGRQAQGMAPDDPGRELEERDLTSLGYGPDMAGRIVGLLSQRELLQDYCRRAAKHGISILCQVSAQYPRNLFDRLGLDGPGSLWCRGDLAILQEKAVALVGSRDLLQENAHFAREVGYQAARQGYVLVSGNARGADQAAQNACLEAGGRVIAVVADGLLDRPARKNVLYVSEDGFDLPFSPQRALRRNRIIHALAEMTFVAQCGYQAGGTWSGTVKNLRFGWSPVYCYKDGSPAQQLLGDMGAQAVEMEHLQDIFLLSHSENSLF